MPHQASLLRSCRAGVNPLRRAGCSWTSLSRRVFSSSGGDDMPPSVPPLLHSPHDDDPYTFSGKVSPPSHSISQEQFT